MAKYLITGGAGFIGSHLSRKLIESGHRVFIIDNLSTGLRENIPEAAEFVKGDISNPNDIKKLNKNDYDAIFHLAAQSSGEISKERPELDLFTNAYGTLMISRFAAESGVKRLIYSSSMSIYGNVAKNPVAEENAALPLSFYGITKLAGEHYVRHFIREGLDATIFRFFSVYGPGQNMNNMKQGMVSIYLNYLLNDRPIIVKGSKDRYRDFIYIDDLIELIVNSIGNRKTYGKTYNVGSGKKTRVEELVSLLIDEYAGKHKVFYRGSTPADQFGLYADISKIKRDVNWKPGTTLRQGIKKMVAWAKKHRSL